jgi:hypothetical protein
MQAVQHSVSKTAVPVNINVLNSTWQQSEYTVDVCVLMEGQPGDNFYPFLVVRLVCLIFCCSQTVFRMLIPEIYQNSMEQL